MASIHAHNCPLYMHRTHMSIIQAPTSTSLLYRHELHCVLYRQTSHLPSVQVYNSHLPILQPNSSSPSVQSEWPSHFQCTGKQVLSAEHLNCRVWHLTGQPSSSDLSGQSAMPSHLAVMLTHAPRAHLNESGGHFSAKDTSHSETSHAIMTH